MDGVNQWRRLTHDAKWF